MKRMMDMLSGNNLLLGSHRSLLLLVLELFDMAYFWISSLAGKGNKKL